ncbi:MAG: DegT/DnrJ/EryC1/StrS family aminotransferase [Hydrogenimonas sp.]|nr:MAG: DegT/DnrJ/EryC1/StrS family aminotransferase [Hydrogenimonas sp.]
MTYVTKVYYPNKEKFKAYIDEIYDNGWLTNNGPLVQKLEKRLEEYLGVKNLLCVTSGTVALELAYRVLETKGEVITTPFSYVSTTSAISETGSIPVFADIDPETFNIDPENIEAQITDQTYAIAPCHVFGNACDIDAIDAIAKRYNLSVVYDASHAFDVTYKGQHILNYGDISAISFHATKIFHTIEGGAIIIKDDALYEKAKVIRNHGSGGPDSVAMLGINGKMNEISAAMGLCMLDEESSIQNDRAMSHEFYQEALQDYVQLQKRNPEASQSLTYFPIVFQSHEEMDQVRKALYEKEIAARQYFYPSLDTIPFVEKRMPMPRSQDLANRILVIPMHSGVESLVVQTIQETLDRVRNQPTTDQPS